VTESASPRNSGLRRTGRARQLARSDDISTPQQQREADRPEPGRTYTGRITEITGQHVYQDVGGRTVAHDRHAPTGWAARDEAMQGQNVEIRFRSGASGLYARLRRPGKWAVSHARLAARINRGSAGGEIAARNLRRYFLCPCVEWPVVTIAGEHALACSFEQIVC
jgi:hypothetical protein